MSEYEIQDDRCRFDISWLEFALENLELWKGVKKLERKMKPETADTGYQIIGICRNSRLDYFPVFARYLYRITIQGNFILAEKSKLLLIWVKF